MVLKDFFSFPNAATGLILGEDSKEKKRLLILPFPIFSNYKMSFPHSKDARPPDAGGGLLVLGIPLHY